MAGDIHEHRDVCMYVCMYIYIYIYIYLHAYTYVNIETDKYAYIRTVLLISLLLVACKLSFKSFCASAAHSGCICSPIGANRAQLAQRLLPLHFSISTSLAFQTG